MNNSSHQKEIPFQLTRLEREFLASPTFFKLVFGVVDLRDPPFLVDIIVLSLLSQSKITWWIAGIQSSRSRKELFAHFQKRINEKNLAGFFRIGKSRITCLITGSVLSSRSLSSLTQAPRLPCDYLWLASWGDLSLPLLKSLLAGKHSTRAVYGVADTVPYSLRRFFKLSSSVSCFQGLKRGFSASRRPSVLIPNTHTTLLLSPPQEDKRKLSALYLQNQEARARSPLFPFLRVLSRNLAPASFPFLIGGMDFGFRHASVLLICARRGKRLYVLDELYRQERTPSEWGSDVKAFIAPYLGKLGRPIWADSEDPGQIKGLQAEGIPVAGVPKNAGSLARGIEWLREQRIWVNPRCGNLIRELEAMRIKSTSPFEIMTPLGDDGLAGLRYAFHKNF